MEERIGTFMGPISPEPLPLGTGASVAANRRERPAVSRRLRAGACRRLVLTSDIFEIMSDNERVSVLLELPGRRVRVVLDRESVAA